MKVSTPLTVCLFFLMVLTSQQEVIPEAWKTFHVKQAVLSIAIIGEGDVQADPAPPYNNGDVVTLLALPGEEWRFNGWSSVNNIIIGGDVTQTLTITGSIWVTATFVPVGTDVGLTTYQRDWLRQGSFNQWDLSWATASPAQNQALYARAEELMNLFENYHLPYNQAANMWWADFDRQMLVHYRSIGDGATFTGYYLAALANKFAVTRDPAVLIQINTVLDTFDMLTTCTSKPGYIPRFVGLTDDPVYMEYYNNYDHGGFPCVEDWSDYTWLGASSRDVYLGAAFGLANVWLHVNDSVAQARARILIERVLDTLIGDSFFVISPEAQFTTPTPIMMATWQRLGLTVNPSKYATLYDYDSAFWLAVTFDMKLTDTWHTTYYVNMLTLNGMYVLGQMEKNPLKREIVRAKFAQLMVQEGGDHLNAYLAATYLGTTGDLASEIALGILQGGLVDYPSGPRWERLVDQRDNPDYFPHYDEEHSMYALLVQDRPLDEMIWQRAPTKLIDGADDGRALEYMGIDLFLPYWLGRQSGALQGP